MSENAPSTPAAFSFGRTRDWPGYFEAVAGGTPRQTLLDALDLFEARPAPDPRFAIDLGCGEGRDTAELLRRGWSVLATDGHPEALELLASRDDLPERASDRLTTRVATFETLDTLPEADLVNASFSLPFCVPEHFDRVWGLAVDAVRPGGRFAGQIFGDRDTWASIADRSHFTRSRAERLFEGFNLELFREDEHDTADASGNAKHWHVYHIVARKR
ncbi:MAG: class I SAM-dependent methyltransferase [Planctomycetota bacterium]